jgi:ricin-type beta-trefoil lectin protein/putative Ig domain-containing protein
MLKRIFAVAAAAAISLLGVTAGTTAQAQPVGHLHGVRVINLHRAFEARLGHTKPGAIAGIVRPVGAQSKQAANAAATCTEPACPVTWQGGHVQHTPHVYLLFWGPNWESDSSQEASATYLQDFFSGLGNNQAQDTWSNITGQYADSTGFPAFSGLVYEGAFNDTSAPPLHASNAQIGAEADTFATNQNITDLNDAQIVVATQSGTCPKGFVGAGCPTGTTVPPNCAYHSWSNEPYINLPYQIDAGTACAEHAVNPAPGGGNDGWSIVGGAEYANTITDPFNDGWFDPGNTVSGGGVVTGGGIGDKCIRLHTGNPGGPFDLELETGSFAVASLWSNASFSSGANGCVQTGAIQDSVSITSPGSQTSPKGVAVNLAIQGKSTAGNPLTWSAIGLPSGLSINSSSGAVTGTPTTVAVYNPVITASDAAGKHHSLQFTWTISPAVASGPIKGDHGKCLDDFGSGTANGNKVDIWDCNATGAQTWTFSGGALSVLGKCLDDSSQGGNGAKLVIWTCNGHKAQTWTHRSNGEYVLKLNGLCLTDPSGSSVNGTQVQVRKCQNFKDQHWSLP